MTSQSTSVIVVGGGNAALCAALSARESGATVTVLEAAPESLRGGNSYFAAGGMRFPHDGLDDLLSFMPEVGQDNAKVNVPPYTTADFFEDLGRDTNYLSDPDEAETLITHSREAIIWLRSQGMRFHWTLGVHAYQVNGEYTFPPGICVSIDGGGSGLVDGLYGAAAAAGISIEYATRVHGLLVDERGRVDGVVATSPGKSQVRKRSHAVVLACGGFESDPALRARYLGPNWDLARVRGTSYNTGLGIRAALSIGAEPFGNWSGCHAIQSDVNAPWSGDREWGDLTQRQSYHFGIIVNGAAQRFVDEGADFHTHTYAKYGREVLRQSDGVAYQIFDAKVMDLMRSEYKLPRTTKAHADTVPELAKMLELDPDELDRTITAFNRSITEEIEFDPNALDGRRTVGTSPPKSNWALAIDTPPFMGFPVTAGITFTFGGLHVDQGARVLDLDRRPIPGLYAAGEVVGGLFYNNYPSGTGLGSGTVFGQLAGAHAASDAH